MFEPGKEPQAAPGQERRWVSDRRNIGERREEIRYEPSKAQRRTGRNRRKRGGWDGCPLR